MGLSVRDYNKHLFDETTDGYIQVLQISNKEVAKISNTRVKGIKEITEEYLGEEDVFISPNTMYIPNRRVENVRQFRALYIDVDNCEGDENYITYEVLGMAEKGEIPQPTMVVGSGRGLHFYWKIQDAPYAALNTWQELQDMLYYKLKKYGADIKATDAARVLRMPNTINSKNQSECRLMWIDKEKKYSMYDLREKYLNYKPKGKQLEIVQVKNTYDKKVINNGFFNSYSLHTTRAEDLYKLCEMRNYNLIGYRNMILHCIAYWKGIYTRDIEELEKDIIDLNNSFKLPLKETEVRAILRCVPVAIEKFIAYEQGVRAGERKRVTKGMKDKDGYWYKNETLIERLKITPGEQKKLKTIIGTDEKYRRKNEKRNKERRNENGLTKKQQDIENIRANILKYKTKNKTNKYISERLQIPIKSVERHITSLKKNGSL